MRKVEAQAVFEIVWERSAARAFDGLPREAQNAVDLAVTALAIEPFPAGSAKLSAAGDQRRIRVGVYRVLYVIDQNPSRIRIVAVGHRRDVYG
jgi:mRNA interferase RelE/StbE